MLNEMIARLSPYDKKGEKIRADANSMKKRKKAAPKKTEIALTIHDVGMLVDPPVTLPAFGPLPYAIQVYVTLYKRRRTIRKKADTSR